MITTTDVQVRRLGRGKLTEESDRRESQRIEVNWPVNIIVDEEVIIGETTDVGINGIHVYCDDPLPMDKILPMRIAPPDMKSIQVRAKVVWADLSAFDSDNNPVGMGVCFVEISEEDMQRFEQALASLK